MKFKTSNYSKSRDRAAICDDGGVVLSVCVCMCVGYVLVNRIFVCFVYIYIYDDVAFIVYYLCAILFGTYQWFICGLSECFFFVSTLV